MAKIVKIVLYSVTVISFSLLVLYLIYSASPTYRGTIKLVNEKYNDIEIYRDEWGIPHLKCQNLVDCMFATGYVHAQDRLWSMHVKRRAAAGRLSQFGGALTKDADIFFRSMGLRRTSQGIYDNLDKTSRQYLTSYSEGVNFYVNNLSFMPLEFLLTGDLFQPWNPVDSISVLSLLSFCMNLDYIFEPVQDLVKNQYGRQFAEELFSSHSQNHIEKVTILSDEDLIQTGIFKEYKKQEHSDYAEISSEVIELISRFSMIDIIDKDFSGMKGSNNWVISGNHTESGYPILSNDPHLDTVIPSTWYQIELSYHSNKQHQNIIGATIPGLPSVMIGRSKYHSWGVTNNVIDVTDLYYETLFGDNYLFEGEYQNLTIIEQKIIVKGEGEHTLKVRYTHHGPLIEYVLDLLDLGRPNQIQHALSLAWTGHSKNQTTFPGTLKLMEAEELNQIEEALYQMSAPALNAVYATVDNHIGYMATGRLPVRKYVDDIFIQNGSLKDHDWVRYYNKSEQPRVIDPKKGFIVSANNKIASDNLVNHISVTQLPQPRSFRINELLYEGILEHHKFTVQDMMTMQMDNQDSYVVLAQYHMGEIYHQYQETVFENDPEKLQKADAIFAIFEQWDCHMRNNSVGASVYAVWEHQYLLKHFHSLSKDPIMKVRATMNWMFDHFIMNKMAEWSSGEGKTDHEWCVNEGNQKSKIPCIYNIIYSFYDSFEYLCQNFGRDSKLWVWSIIHTHQFLHSPFSQTPLRSFFEREYPGEGNRRTINVGGVNVKQRNWNAHFSPNFRMVISMDPNEKSYYVIDTGVSENVFSQHYDDQMQLHRNGHYIEMKWGEHHFPHYQNQLTLQGQASSKPDSKQKDDI